MIEISTCLYVLKYTTLLHEGSRLLTENVEYDCTVQGLRETDHDWSRAMFTSSGSSHVAAKGACGMSFRWDRRALG